MGRPQGRRLGYHTPEQASNRGPRDSRLCITAASRYHLPQRRGCVTRKNPDSILHMAAVNPDPCWSTRARALEHTCIGAHAHMRWSTRALEHTCIGAHLHWSTRALPISSSATCRHLYMRCIGYPRVTEGRAAWRCVYMRDVGYPHVAYQTGAQTVCQTETVRNSHRKYQTGRT